MTQGTDLYFPPSGHHPIAAYSSSSSSSSSLPSLPSPPSSSAASPGLPPSSSSSSSPASSSSSSVSEETGSSGYDGEYRCTATTDVGTVVSRAAVLSRPVLRRFPKSDDIVINVEQGGYVTIPCSAPSSHPPATIWVRAPTGKLLGNPPDDRVLILPSGSVVLKQVSLSDAGNYTCVAVNPVSEHNHSASHHIRLSVTPSSLGSGRGHTEIVDQSVSSVQVTAGETALLECPVAGLGVPARIVWRRDYVGLPQEHTTTDFGHLVIASVDLRDNGSYFCESPSGQKRQVQLQVFVRPNVTADVRGGGDVIRARAGELVRLSCKGQALPAAAVTWYHDGQVKGRPSLNNGREVHQLVLEAVRKADAGVYVCELSNKVGQASAAIRLLVRDAGGDGKADGEKNGAVTGRDVDDVTEGEDDVSRRNFQLQVENSKAKLRNDRLKKKSGRRKTKGRKPNGKNNAGKNDNGNEPMLVPPAAPSVSRLTDTSVLVEWTYPENNGEPISHFVVQYKEVRPKKGEWKTNNDIINAGVRRHKVNRLKPGATYKFRMFAVYANDDNRNGPSRRFHLRATGSSSQLRPQVKPRIVEAKPIIYQNIYAINIKWQFFPTESSSVIGFNIYYRPYDVKEDFKMESLKGAVIRNHLLKDLQPDTEYAIKMECFNSAGASEFSNMVVKRTLPLEGQPPPGLPTPVIPPEDKKTEAPTANRREPGGLDQPVILGIVLGVMLLLLVVFITMCWWKQRQQKRRNRSPESLSKFQDQAQRIYTDSLRKKQLNGGPYPLNGLTQLTNGHGPPRGQPHMNIDVNPLAEMDRLHPGHRSHSPSLNSVTGGGGGGGPHRLYPGKAYHHGNGIVSNGTLPGYGHGHGPASDNNFNSIRHTVSSDNVLTPADHGLANHGLDSLQRSALGLEDYPLSRPCGPPSQPRSFLSSFGHPPTPLHHPYHPHPYHHEHHHHHPHHPSSSSSSSSSHTHPHPLPGRRDSSASHSDDRASSPDETGQRVGGGQARYGLGGQDSASPPSPPLTPPLFGPRLGVPGGPAQPPPAYPGKGGYPPASPRDNVGGRPCGEGRKGGSCYGYEGGCVDLGGVLPAAAAVAYLPPEERAGCRPWASAAAPSPMILSSAASSSHAGSGRPKRRRKRGHGDRDRETVTKDQATNTDLSSNGEEGTADFGALGKSPASSVSNSSDSSVSGGQPTDVTRTLPAVGFPSGSGSGGGGGGYSANSQGLDNAGLQLTLGGRGLRAADAASPSLAGRRDPAASEAERTGPEAGRVCGGPAGGGSDRVLFHAAAPRVTALAVGPL